uniref:Uncharacterized protein n=1 Tax=Palpitomonas bilix TaxID=652834 RepID=A0A7S3D1K9_9EUKA|mmetsp:Transcript_18016/g.44733  ORF Transcript_18016/g.44733 Transcript_18016/m.44733 type:complete len:213 (+) Transcript_18016:130-768(+)
MKGSEEGCVSLLSVSVAELQGAEVTDEDDVAAIEEKSKKKEGQLAAIRSIIEQKVRKCLLVTPPLSLHPPPRPRLTRIYEYCSLTQDSIPSLAFFQAFSVYVNRCIALRWYSMSLLAPSQWHLLAFACCSHCAELCPYPVSLQLDADKISEIKRSKAATKKVHQVIAAATFIVRMNKTNKVPKEIISDWSLLRQGCVGVYSTLNMEVLIFLR